MTSSPADTAIAADRGPRTARWPGVLGVIGIILAALTIYDQFDDLATLGWTAEQWRDYFPPTTAEFVVKVMPPVGLRMLSIAVESGFAVLLLVASVRLRRRQRSAVFLFRLWAWLAIGWTILALAWISWWMERFVRAMPAPSLEHLQGYESLGIGMVMVLMLAFPIFLLIWFARSAVRDEYETWGA